MATSRPGYTPSMSPSIPFFDLAGVFASLGIVFMAVGIAAGKGRRKDWVRMTGYWVEDTSRWSRPPVVDFVVAGTVHRVKPTMKRTAINPKGPMPIAYDPSDPRRAVIDTFVHRGGAFKVVAGALWVCAVAVGALGIAVLALWPQIAP